MRFSASRMKVWMDCPLKAHFQYDERLPRRQNAKASFGTCIHHALELYNRTGNLEVSLEDFRTNWAEPERLGVAPDIWPRMTSYGSLRQRGVEILQQVHESTKWDSRRVIAVEHPFLVNFGRHELTGFVDLVEFRRSGKGVPLLRIVDYKGNGKKPYIAELRLDIQFSIYIYASLQREFWVGNGPDFPGLPDGEALYEEMRPVKRRAIWYHLMTNQELDAGDRDDSDFMRLYRLANSIESADKASIHVPRIGEACGLCDFHEPCGTPIPVRAAITEDENAWL